MRLLLVLLTLFYTGSGFAQPMYSKSTEFAPLRVSFAALQTVLDKAHSLASTANAPKTGDQEELTVHSRDFRVTIPGHSLLDTPAKMPDQVFELRYSYLAGVAAPVSQVTLDLAGYRRTLTVRGTSADQVDALFTTVSADLSTQSHPVGGSVLQAMLQGPLAWILGVLTCLTAWNWRFTKQRSYAMVTLGSLAALLLVVALPLDQLLAGFMAVRGDPSPLIRYGAEISFIGLLLAIVGVPAAIQPILAGRRTSSNPAITTVATAPGSTEMDSARKEPSGDAR